MAEKTSYTEAEKRALDTPVNYQALADRLNQLRDSWNNDYFGGSALSLLASGKMDAAKKVQDEMADINARLANYSTGVLGRKIVNNGGQFEGLSAFQEATDKQTKANAQGNNPTNIAGVKSTIGESNMMDALRKARLGALSDRPNIPANVGGNVAGTGFGLQPTVPVPPLVQARQAVIKKPKGTQDFTGFGG